MARQFPRERTAAEAKTKTAQVTVRMTPDIRALIRELYEAFGPKAYKYESDFVLDLICAGLPHARRDLEKWRASKVR